MNTSPTGHFPSTRPGKHAGPRREAESGPAVDPVDAAASLWPAYRAPVGAPAPRLWWEDDKTVPSGMPSPAAAFRYEPARRPKHGARSARPERRTAPAAASHPVLYAFLGLTLGLLVSGGMLTIVWWVLFGH